MIEDDKAGDNKVEEFALVPEELKSGQATKELRRDYVVSDLLHSALNCKQEWNFNVHNS